MVEDRRWQIENLVQCGLRSRVRGSEDPPWRNRRERRGAMSRFRRGHGFLLWIRCRESCGRPTNKAVQASVNDNARQVQSLRFFSPYRSKHCYTLPAVYNSSYILRAMFLYSNFQAASDQHSFDVSIDSTLADTVNITSAEVDTPQVFEYIDFASSPWMYRPLSPPWSFNLLLPACTMSSTTGNTLRI